MCAYRRCIDIVVHILECHGEWLKWEDHPSWEEKKNFEPIPHDAATMHSSFEAFQFKICFLTYSPLHRGFSINVRINFLCMSCRDLFA